MILHGNARGNSKELAHHLLKEENERVEIHQIRGFVSRNLSCALQESYALSRATKCKQHLYSLSLNPPKHGAPTPQDFEAAINKVEKQLGLDNQPRVIVFHEKRGLDGEVRKTTIGRTGITRRPSSQRLTRPAGSFYGQTQTDVGGKRNRDKRYAALGSKRTKSSSNAI